MEKNKKICSGQKIGSFTIIEYKEYKENKQLYFDFKARCNICGMQISMSKMQQVAEVKR